MLNNFSKPILYSILFLGLGFLIILKVFCFDFYKVDSESMLPTIMPGNFVIINKIAYNFQETGMIKIKMGDIIVFNKPIWDSVGNLPAFYGETYVKRCIGLPGSTVYIDEPESLTRVTRSNIPRYNENIYPHDSSFSWQVNKFGPLWVPKERSKISLNVSNLKLYKKIIQYEGSSVRFTRGFFFINDKRMTTYTFKKNYYFMIGDNFSSSRDSRFWGLVPENNLIGKVIFIL